MWPRVVCQGVDTLTFTEAGSGRTKLVGVQGHQPSGARPDFIPGRAWILSWAVALSNGARALGVTPVATVRAGLTVEVAPSVRVAGMMVLGGPYVADCGSVAMVSIPAGTIGLDIQVGEACEVRAEWAAWDWPDAVRPWEQGRVRGAR